MDDSFNKSVPAIVAVSIKRLPVTPQQKRTQHAPYHIRYQKQV